MNRETYNKAVGCLDNLSIINGNIEKLDNMLEVLSGRGGSMVLKMRSGEKEMTIELSEEAGKTITNKIRAEYHDDLVEQRQKLIKLIDGTILS